MSFLAPPVAGMAIATKNYNKKNTLSHKVFDPNLSIHGKDYQELAENNPYANVQYRQSWIQKMLSGLGFRTNYDAYLEGMNLQAQEYDNALLQKEYDENYNSPLAQAQREREAGLNPNLTGNISSGEASPLQDDGNPPVPPQANDLEMVSSFAGACLQGVQTAFAVAGDLQSLRSMRLQNQGKEIQNNKDFMGFTQEALMKVLPEVYDDQSGIDWTKAMNFYEPLKKAFGKTMSKQQFRNMLNQAGVFQYGLDFKESEFGKRSNYADKRIKFFKDTTGKGWSDTDEGMRAVVQPLSDLRYDLEKDTLETEDKKQLNEYDRQMNVVPKKNYKDEQYEIYRDGKTEALQHNRGLVLDNDLKNEELKMRRYKYKLRKTFDKIMGNLQDLSNKGNGFADVLQLVLSTILLKYIGD